MNEPIIQSHITPEGENLVLEYRDADSFEDLAYLLCRQVYGVCFCDDKVVIGYRGKKNYWGFIGGSIEKGETFEQTLRREVKEESNMEVLSFAPIGYQKVTDPKNDSFFYQLRYVCRVKPYGPFERDADGSITEIKLINPLDIKKHFDWGKIWERITDRALEILPGI